MTQPIVIMAVFEEETLLDKTLESLQQADVKAIHVFDGAWKNFPTGSFSSQDRTEEIARSHGAIWHPATEMWPSQEAKRTYMFHNADAREGDYLFVTDADNPVVGRFGEPLDQPAYTIMARTVGGNDLPKRRGTWPYGDYSEIHKPVLRVFRWNPHLACLWPGGYTLDGKTLLDVYKKDPKAHGGYASALPVIHSITTDHIPTSQPEGRTKQKDAYYAREHPARKGRQRSWRPGQ